MTTDQAVAVARRSCREAYRQELLTLARDDERVVCLDADTGMWDAESTGLGERYVAAGIAEANMMGVAAGLAASGRRPFVTTMATFATTRAAEQVKTDIAAHGLPVRIAGTHSGLSAGHLGPTHHALEDIALMRALPGMTIVVPADADSTARAVRAVAALPGPAYLRLDRAAVPFPHDASGPVFRLGQARILRAGDDVALIACGPYPVAMAVTAADELAGFGIGARVLDLHTLRPFDEDAVVRAAIETGRIVTVEEHAASGGLGDAVSEVVAEHAPCWIRRIAARPPIPLRVGGHEDLLAAAGIRVSAIVAAARDLRTTHHK
ncbi:MAG TPA: transketolase C-terminal domain-containing protein, partial [Pseudonocardiaceae bacterium]